MSAEVGLPRFSSAPSISTDKDVKSYVPRTFGWGHTDDPTQPVRDEERPRLGRGANDLAQGRHASPTRSQQFVSAHGARFTRFSVIGGGIFAAGLALQAGLTTGLHVPSFVSYVIQSVISIEASFLLNRRFTWQERDSAFWPALLRFNVQKTVTVAANLALYAGLLKLGMNYLLANILLTAVFTVVNYVGGDRFVFIPGRTGADPEPSSTSRLQTMPFPVAPGFLPKVSVVIPCRANEGTIRATVDSLLRQDYPNLQKIILIGSPVDTTWDVLMDLRDPRLAIIEVEAPPGIRDANFKRDIGIRRSNSDLVALIDSDMVVPYDWMSRAVTALINSGADCVAGVMRSIRDDFWGRYVDNCRLGAKTPRVTDSYFVTADDFGAGGHKPPITANILFTREAYEQCPIDSSWSHGSLEDYEWFWRVVNSGYRVLVTDRLYGWHHHRAGLSRLAAEYRRSARGCAYFIRVHRTSPFARKRLTQAITLPLGGAAVLAGLSTVAIAGHGLQAVGIMAAMILLSMIVLSGREFVHSRSMESLVYPVPALILGASYTASLVGHLLKRAPISAVPIISNEPSFVLPSDADSGPRFRLSRLLHPLSVILTIQAALSLSMIWSNTVFNDEGDYLWIGHLLIAHWFHGAPWPSSYADGILSGSPIIYPPIGAAADSIGSLAGARILSMIFMMGATTSLWLVSRRLYGPVAASVSAMLWVLSEPAMKLGAFATYDAMSVFLMAMSAWLVIQAGCRARRGELIATASLALGLSAATAYSGVIMIPIVIGFAFLSLRTMLGSRQAAYCAGWLSAATAVCFVGLMEVAHSWRGIMYTVINRQVGGAKATALHVLHDTWSYTGLVLILALVGALLARSFGKPALRDLTFFLVSAGFVVPIAQSHDQTIVSLDKHLAYGVWFTAIAAGCGLAQLSKLSSVLRLTTIGAVLCCGIALAYPGINGWDSTSHDFHSWNNSKSFISAFESTVQHVQGQIYVPNGSMFVTTYSTPQGSDWQRWATGFSKPYAKTIASRQFGIIVLFYTTSISSPALDGTLFLSNGASNIHGELLNLVGANSRNPDLATFTLALEKSRNYRLAAVGPYSSNTANGVYAIWQLQSAK